MENTAVGSSALYGNTQGAYNTGVGYNALNNNQTGNSNTGFGHGALQSTKGSQNTAIGDSALYYNVDGTNNTAVGCQSGNATNSPSTSNCTYLGYNTGVSPSGSSYNNSTAIGASAVITASNQIVLGTASETVSIPGTLSLGSLSLSTLAVGTLYLTSIPSSTIYMTSINGNAFEFYNTSNSGAGFLFYPSTSGSNPGAVQVQITNLGGITASGQVTAASFNATSDYRIKENVKPLDDTFTVDNLRPVIYTLKDSNQQGLGIIAHELQEEYPFMVTGEKDGDETQSVNYTYLIGILIKEIKDLKKTVSIMKTQIRDLQDNL